MTAFDDWKTSPWDGSAAVLQSLMWRHLFPGTCPQRDEDNSKPDICHRAVREVPHTTVQEIKGEGPATLHIPHTQLIHVLS